MTFATTQDIAPAGLSAPETASGKLQRIAYAYIVEKRARGEIPTSIRFLIYELEQRGDLTKERPEVKAGCRTARTALQNFTDAVTRLREIGLVSWDEIIDDTRHADDWSVSFATIKDAVLSAATYARINPWVGVLQPVILTESRGVGGVISRKHGLDYCVPVAAVGGNCRGFLETEVADLVRDPATRVLYLGDADDCGGAIERHTRRILERATGREFDAGTWERLALTPDQVAGLRRRGVRPIQKRDDRYGDGNPHEAFECEAIGQSVIEDIVRERLDQLLPEPLDRVRIRAAEEREAVRRILLGEDGRP